MIGWDDAVPVDLEPIEGTPATWGQMPAEEAAARLATMPDVFRRSDGSALVWIDDRGGTETRPRLADLDVHTCAGLLDARRVCFVRAEKQRLVPVSPPIATCRRIVTTMPGDGWRVIRAVVDAPYLLPDGTLINEAGYRDGLWLARDAVVPLGGLPDVLRIREGGYDADEARVAADFILHELRQVEWATPADRSVALAYLLTLITRPAYRLAPIFLFTAPDSGSGKDLVAKCMENAAFGREAIRINPPPGRAEDTAAELDKRIGAAMLDGESTIVLGDIRRVISPTIYGLTTEERSQGYRVLGQSKSIAVPRNLLIVGVGNNPELGIDIIRRAVSCRLMPRSANPSERVFAKTERELILDYRARRPQMIAAAVNIVRGALRAPRPTMITSSFSEWSAMVQAACIHAGLPDPLEGREALKSRIADDDPRKVLAPLMTEWAALFGTGRDRRKKVAELCQPLQGDATDMTRDYRAAMHEISPTMTPAHLGRLLSSAEDKHFDVERSDGSRQLVQLVKRVVNGSPHYWLHPVE